MPDVTPKEFNGRVIVADVMAGLRTRRSACRWCERKEKVMKQSPEKIRKEIERLRQFIDENPGAPAIETRMAYLAETVLRWASEDTEDWGLPLEESKTMAEILRKDLQP